MSVDNPFIITYGSTALGGTSDIFLLHGPYIIDKSFESLRLVFDVVVVSTSYANLLANATTLEDAFRLRDQDLVIEVDSIANSGTSKWTYTSGTTILNTKATLQKAGDAETDRGYSRAYTCVIEGELPADDSSPGRSPYGSGLRDLQIRVDFEAGRQRFVTLQGIYTADSVQLASANYLDATTGADAEATTILAALGGSYELVKEGYNEDRNNHLVQFDRLYSEMLFNQSSGLLDDTKIRDHEVSFSDISAHPGDSRDSIYRLRRVRASYECWIDIDITTDLQSVFENQIRPHVKASFESIFSPVVFAIEDQQVRYDETIKRVALSMQFVYQKQGGDDLLEFTETLSQVENRTIDYTPTHSGGELDFYADAGWTDKTRVIMSTSMIMGEVSGNGRDPKGGSSSGGTPGGGGIPESGGPEGGGGQRIPNPGIPRGGGGSGTIRPGWNEINNTTQSTPQWIGDPDDEQILVTISKQTRIERFHNSP